MKRRKFMAATSAASLMPMVANAKQAEELTLGQQVQQHMQAITDLIGQGADGIEIDGVNWFVCEGRAHSFWASGRSGHNRANFRPDMFDGWKVTELKFVEAG